MSVKKYHILREYANGVMDEKGKFYPYIAYSNAAADTLTPTKGTKFYVKSAFVAGQVNGIKAESYAKIAVTQPTGTQNILSCELPATTQAVDYFGLTVSNPNVNLLLPLGSIIAATSTASSIRWSVVYAIVDEAEGEYLD